MRFLALKLGRKFMYLIVGLGNPEPEYSKTRHNMGFDTVNLVAEKHNIVLDKKGFDGIYGCGTIESEKVILLKPQTYMNESGKSITQVRDFYKIENKDIIIIYDDIDLDVGVVKLRKSGGAGTHNGMKSVVEQLGTTDFPRIRIGTGKPEFKELLISYVIQKMNEEDYETLTPSIQKAAISVETIIKEGIDIAMNKLNVNDNS